MLVCTVGLAIAKIPSAVGEAPVRAASYEDSTDNTGAFLAGRSKSILPVASRDATFDGKMCRLAERFVSPIACAYLATAWQSTAAWVARKFRTCGSVAGSSPSTYIDFNRRSEKTVPQQRAPSHSLLL